MPITDQVRKPVLAFIGANTVLVEKSREQLRSLPQQAQQLPEQLRELGLRMQDLQRRVETATVEFADRARSTYEEFVDRGDSVVDAARSARSARSAAHGDSEATDGGTATG